MIAVDTNILVYAYLKDAPHHERAWDLVQEVAASPAAWTVPWHCIGEFIAITTTPKVMEEPFPARELRALINDWLVAPGFVQLAEGPRHWDVLSDVMLKSPRLAGRIYDLRIAALCIEHAVRELWTADRDLFAVPGLRVRNPLVDEESPH